MSDKSLDKRPFYWALGVVLLLILCWQALEYAAQQRLHNTPLWQSVHPVMLRSAPQVATPVSVSDTRLSQTIVQTELGVYFLTGARYILKAGEPTIVVANDAWELYLCAANGDRCMTIHSFCASAVWPKLERDSDGQIAGCHAPYLASGRPAAVVAAITNPPPDRAGQQGGRLAKVVVAKGMSHPREWAHLMGLPVASGSVLPSAKP